jgi:hypothetical protein
MAKGWDWRFISKPDMSGERGAKVGKGIGARLGGESV